MTRTEKNPALHWFAVLTAFATLVLIAIGGLVTSKDAGLAVPDWPTTYGYNMFLFPISKMVGGIFYEHTHRLVASVVGFMTMILAAWLWLKESRRWLRLLGIAAFFGVVIQGVLGGLRVLWISDGLAIFHSGLAQAFFVLVAAIALFTSDWWRNLTVKKTIKTGLFDLRWLVLILTFVIFIQLLLGAVMRQQHTALSIADFPLSYGKLFPPLDADSIMRINDERVAVLGIAPTTVALILLQWVHRLLAVFIFLGAVFCAWQMKHAVPELAAFQRLAQTWIVLVAFQIVLGAAIIWTNKAADIATAHVAVGALILMVGSLLAISLFKCLAPSVRNGVMLRQVREPLASGENP